MGTADQIMTDLKEAMRARDQVRVSCLRMARAEALKRSKAAAGQAELDEDAWIGLLSSLIKQRRESAEAFRKGDRAERAEHEEREASILQSYLPTPFTEDELRELVVEAIQTTGAATPRDMGKVMGKLRPVVRGRADGKALATLVRSLLAN